VVVAGSVTVEAVCEWAAEAPTLAQLTASNLLLQVAYGTAQVQARFEGRWPLEHRILARE